MMIVVSNTYHPGVIIMSGLIRKSLVQVEFVVVMIMITVLMTIMWHNVEGNNDNDCHDIKDEKKKKKRNRRRACKQQNDDDTDDEEEDDGEEEVHGYVDNHIDDDNE